MARKGAAPSPAEEPDVSSGFDWGQFTPSAKQATFINARRYGNTLVNGGFMDVAAGGSARQIRRAQKYGAFAGGRYSAKPTAASFMGGGRSKYNVSPFLAKRAAKAAAAGKDPYLNPFRANNLNLKATNRLHSISALGGGDIKGAYNPFNQISAGINKVGMFGAKNEGLRKKMGLADNFNPEKDKVFTGGVLGRIDSLNKLHGIEHTIKVGEASGGASSLQGRALSRFTRAQTQRATMVQNITNVQSLANPGMNAIKNGPAVNAAAKAARAEVRAAASMAPAGMITDDALRLSVRSAGRGAVTAGNAAAATNAAAIAADPANAIASTMTRGALSNRISTFYNGALNAESMSARNLATLNKGFKAIHGGDRVASRGAMAAFKTEMSVGGKYAGNAMMRAAGGGKMIGTGFQMMRAGSRGAGLLAMKTGATRLGGAALGPLSILANAQLMYDIGKGVGKIAVGGMNFAKDAIKSMQGSINKPMFGTGFKDNEVAATSRSRGVMAIQNSRLNARSLLGSEAGMMASHFG